MRSMRAELSWNLLVAAAAGVLLAVAGLGDRQASARAAVTSARMVKLVSP